MKMNQSSALENGNSRLSTPNAEGDCDSLSSLVGEQQSALSSQQPQSQRSSAALPIMIINRSPTSLQAGGGETSTVPSQHSNSTNNKLVSSSTNGMEGDSLPDSGDIGDLNGGGCLTLGGGIIQTIDGQLPQLPGHFFSSLPGTPEGAVSPTITFTDSLWLSGAPRSPIVEKINTYLAERPAKRAKFERTQILLEQSGLLDITKRTAFLMKSNADAQEQLSQLKKEVGEFVDAVLANPENRTKSRAERGKFLMNPLDIERPEQPCPSPSTKVSVIRSHQSRVSSSSSAGVISHGGPTSIANTPTIIAQSPTLQAPQTSLPTHIININLNGSNCQTSNINIISGVKMSSGDSVGNDSEQLIKNRYLNSTTKNRGVISSGTSTSQSQSTGFFNSLGQRQNII